MNGDTPKSLAQQQYAQMAAKLPALVPRGLASIDLDGETFTLASLARTLQSGADLGAAVTEARAKLAAAIKAYDAAEVDVRRTYRRIEAYLKTTRGPSDPALATVGFAPPKPGAVPSTTTLLAAQLKRQHTILSKAPPKAEPIRVRMVDSEGGVIPGSSPLP